MSVIPTYQWLHESYYDPVKICTKLVTYFDQASPLEIYQYLQQYGLYRPIPKGEKVVDNLLEKDAWKAVGKEYTHLKRTWNGPDIPIFIFPSNTFNREIVQLFNGKSGLAFRDKLFLFLSDENTPKEISALLTHEYNHVCRLVLDKKSEEQYTLLDSIILEGLAEAAVREFHGEQFLARWAKAYSRTEAGVMWEKYIAPNQHLSKSTKTHHDILYGTKMFYPKMCGYNTGYHIVQQCIEKSKIPASELLTYPSEKILTLSRFESR